MKIATNVHRDAFGGITISNLALFDWLEDRKDKIIGIEFVGARHILGAAVFRHYDPSFFNHHIINCLDKFSKFPWDKALTAGILRRQWDVLIETTKNVLADEDPDIVLINGTYFAPWILAKAAEELGIPVVLRYAGVLAQEAAHKNYFARRRLLNYERWLASMANAIIFPSLLCCRIVESEILGRKVENGFVIPNPVVISKSPMRPRRQSGRYTIAAIGRWTSIKNFQAFINLHKELLRRKWAHRAIIVTSYRDAKFGIPETIERKDPMSYSDLQKFYRSVDLLVVPSRFETFCNVAAEAVVGGTSVLVSERVGFAEILRRADLGYMVTKSFEDTARVADAVIKVLARKTLSEEKRSNIIKILEPGSIHDRILRILQKVSNERIR